MTRAFRGSKGGLGYFGFTYFEENSDKLKALKIDGGDGCVAPSVETAPDGTYAPLSRPLFIYPSKAGGGQAAGSRRSSTSTSRTTPTSRRQAQFIPITDEQKTKAKSAYDAIAGMTMASDQPRRAR